MTDFVETMKLAEKAQEDIYFAKVNRKLIEELHRRAAAEATRAIAGIVAPGKSAGEREA